MYLHSLVHEFHRVGSIKMVTRIVKSPNNHKSYQYDTRASSLSIVINKTEDPIEVQQWCIDNDLDDLL